MHTPRESESPSAPRNGAFPTTHWSWIVVAKAGDATVNRAALEQICQACWYPLYVFVRRRGYGHADATDITQAFFERLLAQNFLEIVRPEKGRLRSFLLASLNHFMANQWDRERSLKRGGGVVFVPVNAFESETRYQEELPDVRTPAEEYDRQWGLALLSRALECVRLDCAKEGWGERYDAMKAGLMGRTDETTHSEIADRLGLPVATVKTSLHRLRRRLRERLRIEVSATVAGADEVDEEIRYLLRLVAGTT